TMIWMARENRGSAIKLLGNQNACDLMRPCHRAERQDLVGFADERRIVSIRSADRQDEALATGIAQGPDALRKTIGIQTVAAFVEQEQCGAVPPSRKELFTFLAPTIVGRTPPPLRRFAHAAEFEADGWAHLADPGGIAVGDLPFRSCLQAADGMNFYAHAHLDRRINPPDDPKESWV